jgi:hypothetical protein
VFSVVSVCVVSLLFVDVDSDEEEDIILLQNIIMTRN